MPLDYPIATRTLDNGLRVVVSQDHSVPTVTVNIWVDVGSGDERPGQSGLAHLFEHLMFQGSANVAEGEHFSLLMGHGGRVNATTWFDRTNYFATVPTGALDLTLWLEVDRHGRLLQAVTQHNLDNQRDVVKEEKRQRYDNQPYGNAVTDLVECVFPDGHPYQHPTIGSMEDLDRACLETVHAFYRRHYRPAATVVTLVGDVTSEAGFAAVERHFGPLPSAPAPRRPPSPVLTPITRPVRRERVEDVPNDRLYLGFRLPVGHTREFTASALALDAVGGLTISRLHRRLVRGQELSTGLSASAMALARGASLGFIGVDVADGVSAEQVEDAVCEELTRFATQGPTPVELEAALADTERSWLEALAAQDERANLISHYTLLHDDPDYVNTYLDLVAEIGAEDVRHAARTWLQPASRVTVAYLRDAALTEGAA